MPKIESCYWCGAPAVSREHVPPVNLFETGKRNNLVTVPSCYPHNEGFALLDERMRFYLQAIAHSNAVSAQQIAKTVGSLEKPQAKRLAKKLLGGARPYTLPTGRRTSEIPFPPEDYTLFLEKVTRGVHYVEIKTHWVEADFCCAILPSVGMKPSMMDFYQTFARHFNQPKRARVANTPYPDVFRYKYVNEGEEGSRIFGVEMVFYDDFIVIGTLTSKVSEETGVSAIP